VGLCVENSIFAIKRNALIVRNKIRLPDAFIVGAAKSGTTSLYQMLAQHPDIYFPPSEKEPFFFCFGNKRPAYLDDRIIARITWEEQAYHDLYKDAPITSVAVDASTAYLYKHSAVIPNMQTYYGSEFKKIKIIILLRNPIDRAWSHYNFLIRNGLEDLPFLQAIQPEVIAERGEKRWGFDYLGYGKYADQVEAYMKHFDHVKIYLTEDFVNYKDLMKDLQSFLDISPIDFVKVKQANPSGIPRNKNAVNFLRRNSALKKLVNLLPEQYKHSLLEKRDGLMSKFMDKQEMSTEIRQKLLSYYQDDMQKLEKLSGRDLKKWRE